MFKNFNKIDWKLLRKQKLHLLNILDDKKLTPSRLKSLEGILNLIDGIQDDAVEFHGEKTVFGKELNK